MLNQYVVSNVISNVHSFIESFLILQKFSSIKFRIPNSVSIIVISLDSKSFRRIIYLFIVIFHSIFQTHFSFSPFFSVPQFFRRFFERLAFRPSRNPRTARALVITKSRPSLSRLVPGSRPFLLPCNHIRGV